MDECFTLKEKVIYPNGGKSLFYILDDTAVIIDEDICHRAEDGAIFSYTLITDKQNAYMHKYAKVYRFLKEDEKDISDFLKNDNPEFAAIKREVNREDSGAVSPLEFLFEKDFGNVYGLDALKYLHKEYGISDDKGNNFFLDYYVHTKDGDIAVEENGISYHHPQIIGKEQYRKQLNKQNTCVKWGIKLYRFSSEDCLFTERIEDDIVTYFGKDPNNFYNDGITVERKFKLYDHQVATLEDIEESRKSGIKTFLVVYPTGSGKSKIVEEDMAIFARGFKDFKALILAPNINIVSDWYKRLAQSLPHLLNNITVSTYAYAYQHYREYASDYFNYIVIDEAHHAVAPMLKRLIQYFDADFMIGLTATDERLDKQRLESIFGNYRVNLSLKDAMNKGIIATANVYRIETNLDLSKVRFNGHDYVNADLEKSIRVTSRNELIADVLEKYFKDGEVSSRQGVVFCVSVKHAEEMSRILNARGFSSAAYTGGNSKNQKIMEDFKKHKLRFLCSCNMISEGWDYPELGILVMARPTMSKVLYLQQIGRGLRKTTTKKNVFIIDVVDEYGAVVKPCSMHGIFQNPQYVPFGNILKQEYHLGEMIVIDGFKERIEKIVPVDIDNFSELYGTYLSREQLARTYFVNTGTINNWLKKGKIKASVTYPFGNKNIPLFSPEDVEKYRKELNIAIHDDTTVKEDFMAFIRERDYSLSYKMPFLLAFIKHKNSIGDALIEDILDDYIAFYQKRIDSSLPTDRPSCPYNTETLKDRNFIKSSMLSNPFEKFERKRFLYFSKDLGIISLNHALAAKMNDKDWQDIVKQLNEDLINYYRNI